MSTTWRVRFIISFVSVMLAVYFVLPNFVEVPEKDAPWYVKMLPDSQVKLGLDLQGGIHMVLGIDLRRALMNEADRYIRDLKDFLPDQKIDFVSIQREFDSTEIQLLLKDKKNSSDFRTYVQNKFNVLSIVDEDPGEGTFTLDIQEERKNIVERDTIQQALETLRSRLDEFGVAEPSIQAQGKDRIIVQLPGMDDPERAKSVLGRTAQLEFKIVDSESMDGIALETLVASAKKKLRKDASIEDLNLELKGKIPKGTQVLMEETEDGSTGTIVERPYLLKSETLLTGEMLEDARISQGQYGEPEVSLLFNPRGAQIFEEVTGANVGKNMAIILDDKIQSAPTIQDRIGGGRARITLGSLRSRNELMNEAKDLALVLRAGALPAPVEILENRSVGPSLGRDSIERGLKAMLVGALLIIVFMAIYYQISGIAADLAIIVNIVFILACLGVLNATLTLPGIAGIIISLGMAVDANVIIYERIREELRNGKPIKAAVEAGYDRAHLTILDSNLTTVITAFVLLHFGTGPIKGFALTLIFGLIANYFTALWFTRMAFEWIITRFQPKRLSI